jgi:hypothetical protein
MTQIYIIVGVIAVIAALVCYVFVRQTIGERKLERERLQRALNKRAKELLQAIAVFPENFLSKELIIFLYRSIIDAYEQLTKLDASSKTYVEALQTYTAQLEAATRKPDNQQVENIQSPAQINELKQYLNLIGNFLQKTMQRGRLTQKQHTHYLQLLKDLVISLTVNGYTISARQSVEMQKTKLALHHYDLAKKLLIKESPTGFQARIAKINAAMEPLLLLQATEETEVQEGNKNPYTDDNPDDEDKGKWSEFEEDSGWKKKNIYD